MTILILVLNLFLGVGLQTVFGMINALQVIIMLPLLKANLPANAGMVFKELAKIAAFDYYDIAQYTDVWLELEPTDPVNAKLEMVGFETKQYISNVGTFTLFIVVYVLLIACYIIIIPLTWCSAKMR